MDSIHDTRVWQVRGLVQGVGFRWFVSRRADQLGLRGWVRNLRDGSVEVVAQGPESVLEVMHEALRRGPPGARVERVEQVAASPDVTVPNAFEIR
jgi:acylphosphatase